MANGIYSPWKPRPKEEFTFAEAIAAKARPGKQPISFRGRSYALILTLPVRLKDANDVIQAGNHVMSEFFLRVEKEHKTFIKLLNEQKLGFAETQVPAPRVTVTLGTRAIFATASSSDHALASAMALDRLANVLTYAKRTLSGFDALLAEHYLEVVRMA